MSNVRANITQAELTRILKAYRDAGIPIARTEIGRDGKVIVYSAGPEGSAEANPWDST